jgi:hypothetical protein
MEILRDFNTETTILSAVLHGCKTWYLTLRQEDTLKVSDNKVLQVEYWELKEKRGEETGANFVKGIFLNHAAFEIFGRVTIWILGG